MPQVLIVEVLERLRKCHMSPLSMGLALADLRQG